jgi:DNA-binding transcriptional LysR family regulator
MPTRFRYTLHQLRIFHAVAEHGGVTRAAAALHLTQPTVSMQIRQLNEALGVALFAPRGRALRLTPAGQEVLEFAKTLLRAAESLTERLAAIEGMTRGRLRLTAASTAEYFIPRLLGRFQQVHPGVAVELRVVNRAEVLARLRQDVDDLYVMAQPPSEEPVVAVPFLDNPLVVMAPLTHPLAKRRKIALDDLAGYEFVVREPGAGTRLIADTFLAARGVRLSTRLELGSNEAVKQAVIGGLGLAVMSLHALRDELVHHRRLRVLPVDGFPIPSSWHGVRRSDRAPTRVAEAFQGFLREAAPGLAADLAPLLQRRRG